MIKKVFYIIGLLTLNMNLHAHPQTPSAPEAFPARESRFSVSLPEETIRILIQTPSSSPENVDMVASFDGCLDKSGQPQQDCLIAAYWELLKQRLLKEGTTQIILGNGVIITTKTTPKNDDTKSKKK